MMVKSATISIWVDRNNPDKNVVELIRQWNEGSEIPFIHRIKPEWACLIEDVRIAEYQKVTKYLDDAKKKRAIDCRILYRYTYTDEDFKRADFIWTLGISLHDTRTHKLIWNEAETVRSIPCTVCKGPIDVFDAKRMVVSEELFDGVGYDDDTKLPPVPGGWDIANTGHAFVLVSKRFIDVLRKSCGDEFEAVPVISKSTGRPSERIFVIDPILKIVHPCQEHTDHYEDTNICSECGAVHTGGLFGPEHFERSKVDESNILTLFDGYLYLSRKAINALKSEGINQLSLMSPVFICEH